MAWRDDSESLHMTKLSLSVMASWIAVLIAIISNGKTELYMGRVEIRMVFVSVVIAKLVECSVFDPSVKRNLWFGNCSFISLNLARC